MDLADDIAYSTYDLEDSFKAGFLKPIDLLFASEEIRKRVAQKVSKRIGKKISEDDVFLKIREIFSGDFDLPDGIEDIFKSSSREKLESLHFFSIEFAHNISDSIAENAYHRINFTSKLVGSAIRAVTIHKINRKIPALSKIKINEDKKIDVEILKNMVYESQILSPKIQIVSYRSKEIIGTIFDTLSEKNGYMLLPYDFRLLCESFKKPEDRKRVICDFIAGMTDRYALEFYGRLTSENPQTIFKPV